MNKGLKNELKKAQLMIFQLKEQNRKQKEAHQEHATKLACEMNEIDSKIKNSYKNVRRWLIIRKKQFNLKRKNTTLQAENRALEEELERVKRKVSKRNLKILVEEETSKTCR